MNKPTYKHIAKKVKTSHGDAYREARECAQTTKRPSYVFYDVLEKHYQAVAEADKKEFIDNNESVIREIAIIVPNDVKKK